MVLKFVETKMLGSGDEAEAIATLNDFFSRYASILCMTTGNTILYHRTGFTQSLAVCLQVK